MSCVANGRAEERKRRREGARQKEEDESSIVSPVKSDGPLLSTATVQTIPSPLPSNAAELKDTNESVSSDPPAVDTAPPQWPNLSSPQLLHSIPFIPEKLEHFLRCIKEASISVRTRAMRVFKSIACVNRPPSGVEKSPDTTVDARSVDGRYRLRMLLMAWSLSVITTAKDTNVNTVPSVAV